jgi:hypothetical protein
MTTVEFELVTELPEKQRSTRKSKYQEFWAFVTDHTGSWVKWPYDNKSSVSSLAKDRGFEFARRNGDAYVRKP